MQCTSRHGVQQPSLTFILGSATVYSSSSTYKVHCTSTTHDPLSNEEVCEKQAHKVQHASVLKSPVLGTVCRSTGVRWSEAELGRGNISLGRMAAALCKPHISRAEAARRPTGAENAGKATSQQLPGFHLVASVQSQMIPVQHVLQPFPFLGD